MGSVKDRNTVSQSYTRTSSQRSCLHHMTKRPVHFIVKILQELKKVFSLVILLASFLSLVILLASHLGLGNPGSDNSSITPWCIKTCLNELDR